MCDHLVARQIPCEGCGAPAGQKCRTWASETRWACPERLSAVREPKPVRLVTWLDLLEEDLAG